jgi:hypothetical protein
MTKTQWKIVVLASYITFMLNVVYTEIREDANNIKA